MNDAITIYDLLFSFNSGGPSFESNHATNMASVCLDSGRYVFCEASPIPVLERCHSLQFTKINQ